MITVVNAWGLRWCSQYQDYNSARPLHCDDAAWSEMWAGYLPETFEQLGAASLNPESFGGHGWRATCGGVLQPIKPFNYTIAHVDYFEFGWPFYSMSMLHTSWDGSTYHNGVSVPFVAPSVWVRPSDSVFPIRPLWLGFVANTTINALLLGFILRCALVLKRRHRRARGLCVECGYRLGASSRCPECGLAALR